MTILGPEDDSVLLEEPKEWTTTENVVVCQADRIFGTKGDKTKFVLKDGIMRLNGEDHVFVKAVGEAANI